MINNEIYIRRRSRVLLPMEGSGDGGSELALTFLANIQKYAYTFSPRLFSALSASAKEDVESFYASVAAVIQKSLGAHVEYDPMYPGFPAEVMEAEEAALVANALHHYWTEGRFKPRYSFFKPGLTRFHRWPLFKNDPSTFTSLDLGDEDDFKNLFINLMKARSSLSETDRADLSWFFQNYPNAADLVPEGIPFKENTAHILSLMLDIDFERGAREAEKRLKTATDLLRLMTAMSGGDISLAESTWFRSFRRRERRLILGLMENMGNLEEDIKRHSGKWLRAGERLHPGEYPFPKVKEIFRKLRNNEGLDTFAAKFDRALRKDVAGALELLRTRPGELARKLDFLLRYFNSEEQVIEAFKGCAGQVSTRVLLQVLEHFRQRNRQRLAGRVFLPKGQIAKAFAVPDDRLEISEDYCRAVSGICREALITAYAARPPLGRVYVSEELKNYTVPFSQRSAAKALRTISRGSRVGVDPEAGTIRAFIWWKNGLYRTDIDLSAIILDDNWLYKDHVSYTNLRSGKYNICHSGDIVDAPNGACEYIDMDIESVRRHGGRYAVFCILSYTQQPFCDLPECFMGWMERDEPMAGEIYESTELVQKVDLTFNTRISLPVIFDLREKVFIWADLALRHHPEFNNNIEGNFSPITCICRAVAELKKPNLYDLIQLHIAARGTETRHKGEADVIFDLKEGISPYDVDIIMADYL